MGAQEEAAPAAAGVNPLVRGLHWFMRLMYVAFIVLILEWLKGPETGNLVPGKGVIQVLSRSKPSVFGWHVIMFTLAFVVFTPEALLAYTSGQSRKAAAHVHALMHLLTLARRRRRPRRPARTQPQLPSAPSAARFSSAARRPRAR